MADFLTAWVSHWGWLWWLIGLLGFIVFFAVADD